ncbi:hypothetical protein BAU15_05035 [Enterococcus sp. JM4C]|uniref:alpha/beta hydrolase fold domain-containing protein n=1 Tax=Candidatus Enterococcus huntleyi TaxID=1857217 RepID=UPI001379947B|nr:alpha/beta hydrolase [Enterococcus sp. JM4C]KAF1295121.1 hypothetical protein BAU15_05035 [Enterococcus sp. JM4C]
MRYSANFVKQVFKIVNMKKLVGKAMVSPPKRRNITKKQLERTDLNIVYQKLGTHELLTLLPDQPTQKHVLYLHGGGYSLEASPFHKDIQERFAKKFNLKVSYFDYPLAPENTAKQTIETTEEAFERLQELYPDDLFYLFGDSAGGGLATALAQRLRDKEVKRRPRRIALVSPWLDISLSDPRSDELQEADVLLEKELLAKAGKNYAGEWALDDPRVSPLYGNFDFLGYLLVIAGTAEILYPDVLRLQQKIQQSTGTNLQATIVPDMMHDFVVYPLRESVQYVDQIGQFFGA